MLKYILAKVDGHLAGTDEKRIDFNVVNIEHILPQNPHRDWKLSKKDIRRYVNKIGNLTLLSKRINSKVQNLPLDQKLPELDTSTLPITQHLVKLLKDNGCAWGEQHINQRQRWLAEIAYKHIWPI
jgi:lipopolysaccharide export LptBFGC system permease protein LptF